MNSAPHGSQSDFPEACIVSLPCSKVLPRLSCDLKIKPKVLHRAYKALYDPVMVRLVSHLPQPWPDGAHGTLAYALPTASSPCMWPTLQVTLWALAPSPHSTWQPCSHRLGPQGPGSVPPPPELVYRRPLDNRAICLVGSGGS